jgi:hypothetical protein
MDKIKDDQYKKLARSTFAKAAAIFNKVQRSTLAHDTVTQKSGMAFKIPNKTRWNSHFHAMEQLLNFFTKQYGNQPCIEVICDDLEIARFKANEKNFLEAFVQVMRPLAVALDILQGENNCYKGFVLPTLVMLKMHASEVANESVCKPLATKICSSLQTRLDYVFEDKTFVIAALLMPNFKLDWVEEEASRTEYRAVLEAAYKEQCAAIPSTPTADSEEDEQVNSCFFKFQK